MKKHFRRIALVALTMAASLVLTGCGSQIARLEGHQLRLQRLSEANAERIAESLARIEEDLKKLHVALADLRAGNNRWTINTAAPRERKLQEIVQQNSQQQTKYIVPIEQSRDSLQEQTELSQSDIRRVASSADTKPRLQTQRWKKQPDGGWQLQTVQER